MEAIPHSMACELLRMSYTRAKESHDPRTQTHAMIMRPNTYELLGESVNKFADGIEETPERWNGPDKYKYIVHAEEGAVFDCGCRGHWPTGKIMVSCWAACIRCAKAIIQSKISLLVTHRIPGEEHWADEVNFGDDLLAENLRNLKERGVTVQIITDKLDPTNQLSILRSGSLIYP